MARKTAGRVLGGPGGLVIPAAPKIILGADDSWGFQTAGGCNPTSSPHAGIEIKCMLDRVLGIHREHFPFGSGPGSGKFGWPNANQTNDTTLRNPRVIPFIAHGSQGGGAGGFPVKSKDPGGTYINTTPWVKGGTSYTGIDIFTAGKWDSAYTDAFTRIAALPGPVFFNLWMEMDIPAMGAYGGFQGGVGGAGQASFIAAYRHIHDLAVAAGADNIIWVWCPTFSDPDSNKLTYYPGNAYVDVIMLDLYRHFFNGNVDDIYNFAVTNNKPFGIAEAGFAEDATQNTPKGTSKAAMVAELRSSITLPKYEETVFYIYWNYQGVKTQWNNRIDSSASSLTAFQSLAQDPNFDAVYTGAAADSVAPTAPTSVVATSLGASSVQVDFAGQTDNVGVDHVEVWRATGAGAYGLVGSDVATPFTDTGLAAAQLYHYKLKAVDAAGNTSGFSPVANVTTDAAGTDTTAPTAPSGLAALPVSDNEIDLSWTPGTDLNGIAAVQVQRDGTTITTLAGTATTFKDTGLAAGTTHSYTITNSDPAGNKSSASGSAVATTTITGGVDARPLNAIPPKLTDTTPSVASSVGIVDGSWQGSPAPTLDPQVQIADNTTAAQIDLLAAYSLGEL